MPLKPWLAALTLLGATPAAAGPVLCQLVASPLVFGVLDPLTSPTTSSTASLEVTCSTLSAQPVPVALRLFSPRAEGAFATAEGLRFRLFLDQAMTRPFGDEASGGNSLAVNGTAARLVPFRQRFTLYGRIAAPRRGHATGAHEATVTLVLQY